ncbi:transcription antiterminator [Kroppenstedtia pulmonis]|uniref:Transcription antiterminator n=1 Tax=Kroppenstedtia pulmonis TaxID=1380685 RepID=A0A7D3XP16_9BACL|nr:BglG family transcription antiterminator [Kroppenstedtia pulmonis]QKG83242.1 transcription antiterminator [Kroppenstedtia pulmonis]
MLKVHRRLLDLLNQFLKNESVLNRSILSKALGVSTKTIQKDIKELNDLMKPYGAEVESRRGNGYKLRIDDKEKFRRFHQYFFQFDSSRIPSTQEERITYVLTKLLTGKSYIKLEELAEDLYVSKSTVHLLMKDVTDLLLPYNLTIERRPYHGIRVKGDEISLRSCISQYLLPRDVHVPLLENEYELEGISDLHIIRDTVLKCIEETNVYLSDLELDNLVIHIAIAIRRLKEQHYIRSFQLDLQEIVENQEYEIAKNIIGYLEKVLHISFPEEEIFYVAIHLLGTNITTRGLGSLQDVLGEPVYSILEEILQTVRHRMGVNFKQDRELMFGLGLHIKAVMNRIKYGLNIRNPLLKEIKTSYPYAFELALTASDILSRHLDTPINEDETGYLAIHFGVALNRSKDTRPPRRCLLVCASGFGSAQLLKNKIHETFKDEIEIVGVTGYYQLSGEDIARQNIDLVVSTVNISVPLPVPVIKVHSIFDKQDVKAIREGLFIEIRNDVKPYIREDLIFLQHEDSSKEEVIRLLCDRAYQSGLVPEGFYDAVIEREEVSSTALGHSVAVPHPIRPLSDQTFISFCTLKKPIQWKDQQVQLIALLSVKHGNTQDLQMLYDLLYNMMNNAETVHQLVKAESVKNFVNILLKTSVR